MPLRVRVGLGIMSANDYSTLSKALQLQPLHQMPRPLPFCVGARGLPLLQGDAPTIRKYHREMWNEKRFSQISYNSKLPKFSSYAKFLEAHSIDVSTYVIIFFLEPSLLKSNQFSNGRTQAKINKNNFFPSQLLNGRHLI